MNRFAVRLSNFRKNLCSDPQHMDRIYNLIKSWYLHIPIKETNVDIDSFYTIEERAPLPKGFQFRKFNMVDQMVFVRDDELPNSGNFSFKQPAFSLLDFKQFWREGQAVSVFDTEDKKYGSYTNRYPVTRVTNCDYEMIVSVPSIVIETL